MSKKIFALMFLLAVIIAPLSAFAAVKILPRNTLTITVEDFDSETDLITKGGAPKGHVVKFGGWLDLRFLVTHQDGLMNQKQMPLLHGKDVGRTGFYWAGIQDDLVFVRAGSSLQIQREIKDEMTTVPSPREPLFTMYLPQNIKIDLKK